MLLAQQYYIMFFVTLSTGRAAWPSAQDLPGKSW